MNNNKKDIIMETEYEAKFYPVDKDKIRNNLKNIGAELLTPERKMRRTMAGKEVNPHIDCDYIRVRDEGNKVTLSAKIHASADGDLADQKESVVTVSDYEETVSILKVAGLKFGKYQETFRETWGLDGAEVVIDTWPGLETYIEIEAESEDQVKNAAIKLGLSWKERIITSVVEIYADIYGLTFEQVRTNIANLTFENNPFNKIKEVKEKLIL